MTATLFLVLAILSEVAGTCLLKVSEGFSLWLPSIGSLACYIGSLAFAALALKHGIALGTGYAVWSGLGLALVTLAGRIFFRQSLDTPALLGIGLILTGVLVIRLWSKSLDWTS
ncbi:MAG: DMT family transporter [Akkermansiaceae bacterium]